MATATEEAAAGRVTVDAVPDLDGLYLVGEFLGFRDRDPRTVGDKTYRNCDVGIRVGGTIETVQYGDRRGAEEAVGLANVHDRIALLCVNQSGVKDGRAWQFYTGARASAPSAFADEFGV